MIEYDLHVHSLFSTDSEASPESHIEKALSLGMKGICFTDHMDLYFPEQCIRGEDGNFVFEPDAYFEKMISLKEKYKDKADIRIGMEIGLRNEPGIKEQCVEGYRQLLDKYPFDFIIGSTHVLENTDPYYEDYWNGETEEGSGKGQKTAEEGIAGYFDAIIENISGSFDFDTLGHLDYIVRYVSKKAALRSVGMRSGLCTEAFLEDMARYKSFYGKNVYKPSEYLDRLEIILKRIISDGRALEINSAGLGYGLGFAHPRKEILERYRELGGELITIGSDAHNAGRLAGGFETVREQLLELGFRHYFVYKERKPEGLSL